MSKWQDLTGKKFGRLTVAELVSKHGNYSIYKCICDCSSILNVRSGNLRTGNTQSCGCYHKSQTSKAKKVHGFAKKHPIYSIWEGMKKRCYIQTCKAYKNYGGRGITVCNEWHNDFQPFYDWSIKNGWQKGLTIDRINNNGNYEPSNCRWITMKEQARNTRVNKLNPVKVMTMRNLYRMGAFTKSELAQIYNITRSTACNVINNKIWV